jgi:REP element-mobilizing transposase RayT
MHHRRSFRLKGYDYARKGYYFITICTKDRKHFFGKISNGEMILSETGCIAETFLAEVSIHFSNAMVAAHVVMPNHIHLILVLNDNRKFAADDNGNLTGQGIRVGVGPCYGVGVGPCHGVGTCHGISLQVSNDVPAGPRHGVAPQSNLFGQPVAGSVSVIINQYKAAVKRWCNKNGHAGFHWQSRFHDHIIRNEESFKNIITYIRNNPRHWKENKFYQKYTGYEAP